MTPLTEQEITLRTEAASNASKEWILAGVGSERAHERWGTLDSLRGAAPPQTGRCPNELERINDLVNRDLYGDESSCKEDRKKER
jgi:hypothetical protein